MVYHGENLRKCEHVFIYDSILNVLAGNDNIVEISNKFAFWPDSTIHIVVTSPWVQKNTVFDDVHLV